jgi:GTPase involved in cell partitioning and DNA repair
LFFLFIFFLNCSNEETGIKVINDLNIYKSELKKYNQTINSIINSKIVNQIIKSNLFELYKKNLIYQQKISKLFEKPLAVNENHFNEIEKLKIEIKLLMSEQTKLRQKVIKITGMENFFEDALLKSENER